jgi:hypothetical protein
MNAEGLARVALQRQNKKKKPNNYKLHVLLQVQTESSLITHWQKRSYISI